MTDPGTCTTEHSSWQWELVRQYEDGSQTADQWNAPTLAVVAEWYAKNLPSEQANARYHKSYHRNHRQLSNRLGAANVATAPIAALDTIWESLLTRYLSSPT